MDAASSQRELKTRGLATKSMSVISSGRNSASLHSASVRFSQVSEMVNPQPWQQELGIPVGLDYLSPRKLSQISGQDNLEQVTHLELSVDSTENSLGNFGVHVPNLAHLRFSSGTVPCVRDLGSSLSNLTVLWMPSCKLRDLDGLPALGRLRELYVAFNEISDVCLVSMLSDLEILDIESNELSNTDQLGYLSLCPVLTVLTLVGNPLCSLLGQQQDTEEQGYRSAVFEAITTLKSLDDCTQVSESSEQSSNSMFALSEAGMERDWHLVAAGIKQQGRPSEQDQDRETLNRSRQSVSPPPSTASMLDDSSELTHGLSQVICGNPVRALRQRKRHSLTSQSAVTITPHLEEPGALDRLDTASVATLRQPDHLALRLPTPPKPNPSAPRPHTVAGFRQRRFRKTSTELSLNNNT